LFPRRCLILDAQRHSALQVYP